MLTEDETLRTLREMAEGAARLLRDHEEKRAAPPAAAPEVAAAPAAGLAVGDVVALEERAALARARLDDAYLSQDQLEKDQKVTLLEIEEEAARLETLRAGVARAQEAIAEGERHAADAARLEARRAELEAEAARCAALTKDLESKAAEAAQAGAAARAAKNLTDKLWPAWLANGKLAGWKEKLETAVAADRATPAAALLFAALHGYTASTMDADLKLLHDSLREVSRRLFLWLRENGLDESGAVDAAGDFAAEINRECLGRAEVEIPILGAPATNQWMIFRPKPGVNSPDVAAVQTWCVRNAQKQPVHRAEITV